MTTDRARVVKIDGAPRVGKTTRLEEAVLDERDNGRSITDVYYVTFARSGREESALALAEAYPDVKMEDVRSRAKTFHGVAYTTCAQNDLFENPDVQIITQRDDEHVYKQFCQQRGIRYVGESGNVLKKIRNGEDLSAAGDRLFAVSQWLTLKQLPADQNHRAPQDLPWPGNRAPTLLKEWDQFKRTARGLRMFEHHDYVEEAIERRYVPDADVLYIDEFQDLSPQEYRLYKFWRDSGEIDTVYIAGDPEQSIYSFRAAKPLYFEETDVDESEVLKESGRCPSAVADAAHEVLSSCAVTDPRGFAGRVDGGRVRRAPLDSAEKLATAVADAADATETESDVYVLARTNYHAWRVAKALKGRNVPHRWLGRRRNAWEDLAGTLQALRSIQRGAGRIGGQSGTELLERAPRSVSRRQSELTAETGEGFDPRAVRAAFDGAAAPEIPSKLDLTDARQEMLVSALRSDRELTPEDVRIGTIHSSKGLEADTVFLVDGYPSTLREAYRDNEAVRAEEHRLYYVGVTRAERELVVVDDYCDGAAPPLEVIP